MAIELMCGDGYLLVQLAPRGTWHLCRESGASTGKGVTKCGRAVRFHDPGVTFRVCAVLSKSEGLNVCKRCLADSCYQAPAVLESAR